MARRLAVSSGESKPPRPVPNACERNHLLTLTSTASDVPSRYTVRTVARSEHADSATHPPPPTPQYLRGMG